MQSIGEKPRLWTCLGTTLLVVAVYAVVWGHEGLPYRFFPGGDPQAYWYTTAPLNPYHWRPEYLSTDLTLAVTGSFYRTFFANTPSVLVVWTISCHCGILALLTAIVYRLTASLVTTGFTVLLFATSAWPVTYIFFWSYVPIAAFYATGCVGALLLSTRSGRPSFYMSFAGVFAVLAIWSCASGVVVVGGACLLSIYVYRPFRDWRETLPLALFFGTLVLGLSPFLTNHFRESYVYHIQEDFSDGHLRAALGKFGWMPPAPRYYAPLIFGASGPTNAEAPYYSPLEQLATDLASNTVAKYNLITPDQFNDMHTALNGGFTYNGVHYTGDAANIAQGDNFLSKIIPVIEKSQAFKNNGVIVIWFDETEAQNKTDTTEDDFSHTLTEIVISPVAKGNAYASTLDYTHSSDLKTLQEIFGVSAPGGGYLGDANTPGTNNLSDLFKPRAAKVLKVGQDLIADRQVVQALQVDIKQDLQELQAVQQQIASDITAGDFKALDQAFRQEFKIVRDIAKDLCELRHQEHDIRQDADELNDLTTVFNKV